MRGRVGRLGIGIMVRDHAATLYRVNAANQRRVSLSDVGIFFACPVLAGVFAWSRNVHLYGTQSMLAGIAILTGLLFGLLVHVFSLGLKISDETKYTPASKITILIDELRANVSYACGVSLLLTSILSVGAALVKESDTKGLPVPASALIVALSFHLLLTLLMVLKRIRTSYKLLAK